jgi:hypothetical protein
VVPAFLGIGVENAVATNSELADMLNIVKVMRLKPSSGVPYTKLGLEKGIFVEFWIAQPLLRRFTWAGR